REGRVGWAGRPVTWAWGGVVPGAGSGTGWSLVTPTGAARAAAGRALVSSTIFAWPGAGRVVDTGPPLGGGRGPGGGGGGAGGAGGTACPVITTVPPVPLLLVKVTVSWVRLSMWNVIVPPTSLPFSVMSKEPTYSSPAALRPPSKLPCSWECAPMPCQSACKWTSPGPLAVSCHVPPVVGVHVPVTFGGSARAVAEPSGKTSSTAASATATRSERLRTNSL